MSTLDPRPFRVAATDRLEALPDTWFQVEYRSKEEALRAAFGPDWHLTYVPVPEPSGWTLRGYLLTADGSETRLLVFFQDSVARWYHPDQTRRPSVTYLRRHLNGVIKTLQAAHDLPSLIGWQVAAADRTGNRLPRPPEGQRPHRQQFRVAQALFEAWLAEQDLPPDTEAAVRTLAALTDYRDVADLVAD